MFDFQVATALVHADNLCSKLFQRFHLLNPVFPLVTFKKGIKKKITKKKKNKQAQVTQINSTFLYLSYNLVDKHSVCVFGVSSFTACQPIQTPLLFPLFSVLSATLNS